MKLRMKATMDEVADKGGGDSETMGEGSDPELRLGITLYGLQGPIGEKAKRGKERSELRDLVISLSRRKKREKNKREKKKREEPVPRVLLFPNSPV
ncbi:hypothetical protein GW17_00021494 [Ensete ventricosum]|nr:hypothetical protein GW17_00021494 [Ensete ventricosum]